MNQLEDSLCFEPHRKVSPYYLIKIADSGWFIRKGRNLVEQIAQATKVPRPYLSKIMLSLAKSGIVKSQRGIGGGFALERDPEEMTILEVVNAVDPIRRILTCPLDLKSHGVRLCPLHRRLDQAIAVVEEMFRNTTLAEILSQTNENVPLCEFPVSPFIKKSKR